MGTHAETLWKSVKTFSVIDKKICISFYCDDPEKKYENLKAYRKQTLTMEVYMKDSRINPKHRSALSGLFPAHFLQMKLKFSAVHLTMILLLCLAVINACSSEPSEDSTIYIGPSADGKAVTLMKSMFPHVIATEKNTPSNPAAPLLVSSRDMEEPHIQRALQQAYEAGHPVSVTDATRTDGKRLAQILGIRNGHGFEMPDDTTTVPLLGFQKIRDGQRTQYHCHVMYPSIPMNTPLQNETFSAKEPLSDWLRKIHTRSADSLREEEKVRRSALSQEASLADMASATVFNSIVHYDNSDSAISWTNFHWSLRSFDQKKDYYLVSQELQYYLGSGDLPSGYHYTDWTNLVYTTPRNVSNFDFLSVYQPSPQSSESVTTYTTSTSTTVGGTVGMDATNGPNASLSTSYTVGHSKSVTVPSTFITFTAIPGAAAFEWKYKLSDNKTFKYGNATYIVDNAWIWIVDFDYYTSYPGAPRTTNPNPVEQLAYGFALKMDTIRSKHHTERMHAYPWQDVGVEGSSYYLLPQPFDSYTLEDPTVTGISPATVSAGQSFTITGTHLYPGLISGVLIGGTPLSADNYTTVSSTSIEVIAPRQSGTDQPVVVKTEKGMSNSDVTLTIQ